MSQPDGVPHLVTNCAYAIAAWCGFALSLPVAKAVAVTITVLQTTLVLLLLWPDLRRRFVNSPARSTLPLQLAHGCRFAAAATFAAFGAYALACVAAATAAAVVVLHGLRLRVARLAEQGV